MVSIREVLFRQQSLSCRSRGDLHSEGRPVRQSGPALADVRISPPPPKSHLTSTELVAESVLSLGSAGVERAATRLDSSPFRTSVGQGAKAHHGSSDQRGVLRLAS